MMGRQRLAFHARLVMALVLNLSFAAAKATSLENASASCLELQRADFSQVLDAPTKIDATQVVEPTADEPGYCQVTGYVQPQVGFLLRLPLSSWNGKFLQQGCGGFCGSPIGGAAAGKSTVCLDAVRRGYACIYSDGGHSGGGGLWAYNNLQAEVDYAIRGPHVTTLAGKAIVRNYYRKGPHKSYFWGCSKGGKQALMEAQRFPWDYDGILAGDPSMGGGDIAMAFLWAARALTDDGGPLIFENSDLETLHQAVVEKCDLNDGIKDGLIGDPRACNFDPSELRCTAGKRPECLTSRQVQAAQKIYTTPVTSGGIRIMTPVAAKGSELTWGWFISGADGLADWFRYFAFRPHPGPAWKPADFDFDRDFKRLGVTRALHSPDNPDLREFKAAGGKLLAYQAWNTVAPQSFVEYYETVQRTMGGRAATQEFFRFFAVPGMNHCGGGEGAFAVDFLSYLEAWVEEGRAPDRLLSAHIRVVDPSDAYAPRFPLNAGQIEFTRPIYPYPVRARYRGQGDPRNADNFAPAEPDGVTP